MVLQECNIRSTTFRTVYSVVPGSQFIQQIYRYTEDVCKSKSYQPMSKD